MTEQTSTELYGVPWYHVRTEELLRLLHIYKTNGEKRIMEFQNRRSFVRERQDFLQKRRIARLRMEGIIIDLEAVKRRCKAPQESLWYEDVDEEEKRKLMKRRLKEMFKTQHYIRRMGQKSDTSSDESSEDDEDDAVTLVPEKPQRGQILRHYTQMYKRDQGNENGNEKEKKKKTNKNKKSTENKSGKDDEKNTKIGEKGDTQNLTDPTDVVKESIVKLNSLSESDRKPAPCRFRKAVKRITALNRLGRRPISPVLEVPNLGSKSRNSSAGSGRSKTPNLPKIDSGRSSKT